MRILSKVQKGIQWRVRKWFVRPLRKAWKSTPIWRWYIEKTRRKVWGKLMAETLPTIYDSHREEPLDENQIIIIEKKYAALDNSLAYLYRKLTEDYNYDVHVHYLGFYRVSRETCIKNCKALFEDMSTAKYVFLNDSISIMGCFKRRQEQKIIQFWHACGAFKRFGMSTGDMIFGMSSEEQKEEKAHSNYTCVTVSSPDICWAYEEAFDIPKESGIVRPLGISRTDVFFEKNTEKNAYECLYRKFPQAKGKKVILFAPTYRGRLATATTPMLDLEKFYEAFHDDYVLITKHHPLVKKIPPIPEKMKDSFAYDATATMSIEDLLMVSDICISDYSSLIFEYSLFTKPMLFYAYDLDEYFDWRGFYYPYDELTPGPVCKTNEEMIDYIQHIDERFDPEVVRKFREKFMSACDGHATERILEDTMGAAELARHRKKG